MRALYTGSCYKECPLRQKTFLLRVLLNHLLGCLPFQGHDETLLESRNLILLRTNCSLQGFGPRLDTQVIAFKELPSTELPLKRTRKDSQSFKNHQYFSFISLSHPLTQKTCVFLSPLKLQGHLNLDPKFSYSTSLLDSPYLQISDLGQFISD